MQQFRIILLLLFAFSVAFFAIINHEPLEINFFYIQYFSISKALLILISIIVGSLGTMLALLPSIWKKKRIIKESKKNMLKKEAEIEALKKENLETRAEVIHQSIPEKTEGTIDTDNAESKTL